MSPGNRAAVRQAAAKGLVIHASTEFRSVAAALQRQGLPAVCVVPSDAPAVFRHEGVRFVACPRQPPGKRRPQGSMHQLQRPLGLAALRSGRAFG